jgi:hypothetical protein
VCVCLVITFPPVPGSPSFLKLEDGLDRISN